MTWEQSNDRRSGAINGDSVPEGKDQIADAVFTQTLTVARAVGDSLMLAIAEDNLSEHYLHLGRYRDAAGLLSSALQKVASLHAVNVAMYAIDGAARLAAYRHDGRVAATLLGATESVRERIAAPIWASANARHERLLAIVHDSLDPQTFDRCWADGRSMRFNEAVDAALTFLRAVEAEPSRVNENGHFPTSTRQGGHVCDPG